MTEFNEQDKNFAKRVFPGILDLFKREEDTLRDRIQGLPLHERIACYTRLSTNGQFLLSIEHLTKQSSSDKQEPPSTPLETPDAPSVG